MFLSRPLATLATLAAFALLLPTASLTAGLITTGPIQWTAGAGGNDHYYALVMPDQVADDFSWTSANAAATASTLLGSPGHLVTVSSLAEHQFLEQTFAASIRPGPPETDFIWIGLTDVAQEGTFAWVTGEPFSFQRWASGEPNNINNEDYVHYWRRDGLFEWNDQIDNPDFTNLRGYIVEYDGPFSAATVPEPASMLVWLTGVLMSVGIRLCTTCR